MAGRSYLEVIQPVWERVGFNDGPSAFLDRFALITGRQQALLASHCCRAEVCKGGLSRFFGNAAGMLAPEAAEGFRAIGMPKVATIVEESVAMFGADYPRDLEARNDALDRLSEDLNEAPADGPAEEADDEWHDPFAALNRRFFDLIDEENGGYAAAADRYAFAE